ncbi:hypothetical protein Smlt3095 [Stenotrophomonas maltophilia K279a]|uniref:Uncharacterized protein n=1 Tax=Stenotrophomonas maltophilia (strain K279a) TaxID=522373 RepID=B2FKE7_STRMK|nr:hypothetical protein Smlt3095 [Stenotrophomonas maltophilia K279a]
MFRRRLRPPSFYAGKRANQGWHLPGDVCVPTKVGTYREMCACQPRLAPTGRCVRANQGWHLPGDVCVPTKVGTYREM